VGEITFDLLIALDKDNSHTLSKQELREYGDGTLTEIFIERDEYDKALAKLKDLITNVASFTNREIFDMWRAMWEITYISQEEEDARKAKKK
jgi:hypothetical protein